MYAYFGNLQWDQKILNGENSSETRKALKGMFTIYPFKKYLKKPLSLHQMP